MPTIFPFKREKSPIFGEIRRPIAEVAFLSKESQVWQPVTMMVDTGADYTLLPRFLATPLEIDLKKDCRQIETRGVGGKVMVYLLKGKIRAQVGEYDRLVPIGFLAADYVPPLLGRHEFLETFRLVFEEFRTRFE